jgi:mono/diheme cytochrome c family protein
MRNIAAALGFILVLTACSADTPAPTFPTIGLGIDDAPPVPDIDTARATAGQFTYLQNCATCHQPNLSGADDWMARDEDGKLKPPPLDSTGHAWHHSDGLLAEVIADGSFDSDSNMKGFADHLSEAEIADVIEFLKSTWGPDEQSFQWFITWQESQQ